ncbi:hypothetical protein BH20GEM1_BH20GEM1_12250 [soil metagenome]
MGLALACGSGATGPSAPEAPDQAVPIRGKIGDLRFEALLLQPSWDRLVGRMTLINPTPDPIALRFPDNCVVLMRLYGLFDNQLVADAHSKRCIPLPVEVTLEPGESRTFETNVTFFFVLGNEVPEGRYHVTLYLRPEGSEVVEIAVGRPRMVRPDEPPL